MRAREADRCSRAAKVLLFHHPDNDALPRITEIMDETAIRAAFATAVSTWGDKPFFAVPSGEGHGYLEAGFEISYGEAAKQVEALAALYRTAEYGLGQKPPATAAAP